MSDPVSPSPAAAPVAAPVQPVEDWQKRAAEAESRLAELSTRVSELQQQLKVQADAHATVQNSRDLESAGAIDVEIVRTLVENLVRQTHFPTFADAIAELKRRKPFLFRALSPLLGSPQMESPAPAACTGDRRSILDFLRGKRSS
jgi:hypothetical protein